MISKVASYEGKEIVFGIRPEDIYDKLFVQEAPPENTVTARVDVVEPMVRRFIFIWLPKAVLHRARRRA